MLSFPNQGENIFSLVGYIGSDRSTPRRYNFSFGPSMATNTNPMLGIFGQGIGTQALGLMSRSGTRYTIGSGALSQIVGT